MLDELGEHKGAFVGLFVATGVSMLGFSILEPILPTYAQDLGASGVIVGLIFSGFAISRGVLAPFTGRVSDSYGRKNLLLTGLGLFAVLSIAYSMVSSPLMLGVVRFCQGFSSVLVTPIAQSYVGDITPEGSEGSITNLFYVSLFGGIAIGPTVGGYFADHAIHTPWFTLTGITTPFYVMAALTVVSFFLVVVLVPELPDDVRDTAGAPNPWEAARAVWADFELRGIMTYIVARGFYRWGFNSFFPVLATSAAFGLSSTMVGVVLSVYMAVGGVLQIPLGRLSDDYAEYRVHFIVTGGLLSAFTMLAVPFATTLPLLIGLMICMGAFSAVSRTSAVAIRTERGRVHGMGLVTGAFTASLSAGQVFGPVGFGAITDTFRIQDAFYIGGIVGIIGTLGAFYYLQKGLQQDDEAVEGVTEDTQPLD
ncbi:MFS transporter [Haladaptatus sp.]|uniref:MFS transporter n=1 Tax=Haladaptatus sp. TaxID=1973141 RepID=UPI003C374B2D